MGSFICFLPISSNKICKRLPSQGKCGNFDPFFHWNLILWYSKHILSHSEGSQKCIFHALFRGCNWSSGGAGLVLEIRVAQVACWEDQKAGWPKNIIAEEAEGTKQLARSFIYWIEQLGNFVLWLLVGNWWDIVQNRWDRSKMCL